VNAPIFTHVVVVLLLSSVLLVVFHRLRVPTVLGFIVAGMVAGPSGLGLVRAGHEVDVLAEIGVVLLLFTVGLEISVDTLGKMKRVGGAGLLQVTVTVGAGAAVLAVAGEAAPRAVYLGLLLALSSTAIVLRSLQERAELDAPHGTAALGILVVQDLLVAPMILAVPLLAGASLRPGGHLAAELLGTAVLLALAVMARWVVPWALHQIVRTRDGELFVISVVAMCLAVAWLTYKAHLSLALGAFLAGLIISSSEYGHQALANVLPLRHVFTSFFFISVGMLVNLRIAAEHWVVVIPAALAVMLLKALLIVGVLLALRFPPRVAVQTGIVLAQVGEFAFVLLKSGSDRGLVGGAAYQVALAVILLTMGITPLLVSAAPRLGRVLVRRGWGRAPAETPPGTRALADHLVIVGYGLVGRNVARAATAAGIPHIALEMNPETVKAARSRGEPVFYGDAVHESVLRSVRVESARVLAVAVSDPVAIRTVVTAARRLNPALHLIVRTRFVRDLEELVDLGADQVIPEEFETSVEIFTRVLGAYLVPRTDIDAVAAEIRAEGYQMLRSASGDRLTAGGIERALPGLEIAVFRAEAGSAAASRTLGELELRRRHGVTVLALHRGTEVRANPGGGERVEPRDALVLLGTSDALVETAPLFEAGQ
jgi:CPA2 family monovalent cation:H+ antiporter-2